MIYGCFLEKNKEDRCFTDYFGIESPDPNFFYTTDELNIETVKEKLKEKFYKKYKMEAFTKEEFDGKKVADALKGIDIAEFGELSSDAKYTFEYISYAVDTIELKQIEEKEYNYGKGSEPTEWYCISYRSGGKETIVYVPCEEYFDSKESWEDFVEKMTGKDALGYTRELEKRPSECAEFDDNDEGNGRILDEELNPMEIIVFKKDVLKKISYGSSSSSSSSSDYDDSDDSDYDSDSDKDSRNRVKSQTKVIVHPIANAQTRSILGKSKTQNGIIISGSSSSSYEEENEEENAEEKPAGEEELILNGQKIKKIRIVGEKLESDPTNWRYVITKGGEELIIYPSLEQKKPDEIVGILLEINAKAQDEDNNETLSKFIKEHGQKALKEIEKAAAYVKSWKQFKSTPAQIFGTNINFDYCNNINGKKATNSMNYGEIIKLYTETSDTKAAKEKKEEGRKGENEEENAEEKPAGEEKKEEKEKEEKEKEEKEKEEKEKKEKEKEEKEKKERIECRISEKKGKKLSTECIKQIMNKMKGKIETLLPGPDQPNHKPENFLGYNFLNITIDIMPDKTEYKDYMTGIINKFDNLEQFGFSDKKNIKSLQKLVETKFKIDKSSKYGRTAYGIVLIATALAYYDYCLSQSEGNVDDALHIITKDLPKTIKNLDRTGLRNTTIAKKNCLTELNKMLKKIKEEAKEQTKKQTKEETKEKTEEETEEEITSEE